MDGWYTTARSKIGEQDGGVPAFSGRHAYYVRWVADLTGPVEVLNRDDKPSPRTDWQAELIDIALAKLRENFEIDFVLRK